MDTVGTDGGRREYDFALHPPHPGILADLRTWIRQVVDGLAPATVADLELVCIELATNALEHAAGPRRVRIFGCGLGTDTVRVEVEDASPDLVPTVGVSRVSRQRGRGLVLVGALASWGIRRERHGKTLWAELPVRAGT